MNERLLVQHHVLAYKQIPIQDLCFYLYHTVKFSHSINDYQHCQLFWGQYYCVILHKQHICKLKVLKFLFYSEITAAVTQDTEQLACGRVTVKFVDITDSRLATIRILLLVYCWVMRSPRLHIVNQPLQPLQSDTHSFHLLVKSTFQTGSQLLEHEGESLGHQLDFKPPMNFTFH